MNSEGDTFNAVVTNTKSGEFFTFKLKSYKSDIYSNANVLSDRIYEKITGTKGVFSTKLVFSMNWHGVRQIFLSDLTGKSLKKLTVNKGDSIAPKISHNRQYIVYTQYLSGSGTALRIINLYNMEDRLLFSSREINLAGGFEKDDKSFYFVSFDGKVSKVYEYFLADNSKKELYRSRARIVSPVTTYNDGKIAFVADEYGGPQVFILEKSDRKLTKSSQKPDYVTSPSFTNQGSHYVYVGRFNGVNRLYITSLDGGDFVQLTHGGQNYEDPIWLSNERFVVSFVHTGDSSQFILIDIPTQMNIKLYNVPAKIGYLSAS